MTIQTPTQTLHGRKSTPKLFDMLNRASSYKRMGPVTPVMIMGLPENRANSDPATHEVIKVSGIPIKLSDLVAVRPPKAMAPDKAAK